MAFASNLERERSIMKNYFYTERCLYFIQPMFSADVIHNEKRAANRGKVALLILSLILLYPQYKVLSFILASEYLSALLIHLACILVAGLYVWYAIAKDYGGSYAALLSIVLTVTGIIGVGGMIITLTLGFFLSKKSQSFAQWFYQFYFDTRKNEPEELCDNFVYNIDLSWRDYDISPFKDILQYGTDDQKRRALAKMMKRFQPAFGPLMLKALTEDKSNLVRVQAATTINKIKNRFFEIISRLKVLKNEFPDSPEILISLGTAYDDLAYSGILDPDQQEENRKEALYWYTQYKNQKNSNHDISLLIGRIHLRNKEYASALGYFEQALEKNRNDLRIWARYAECLFHLKMFDRLEKESVEYYPKFVDNPAFPNEIISVVRAWANTKSQIHNK
jgi:tetratricopeptide (TPR) repeat protein